MIFSKQQKISADEIALFFKQLAALIAANIPLLQSCQLLIQSQKNSSFKLIIHSIKNDIAAGNNLEKSLLKFPNIFNHLICQLIKTGETTGTLDKLLDQVATQLEKSQALKNQIKQALFYPVTVLIISLLICLIMLIFIVPYFDTFFQHQQGQLPLFTIVIIKLSHLLRSYYCLLLMIIPMLLILCKHTLYLYFTRLPFIKTLLLNIFILHFIRNLTTSYAAGIPIPDALQLVSTITKQPDQIKLILKIKDKVSSGQSLNSAMQSCPLFNSYIIQMVRLGEQSGTLQKMLEAIINHYTISIDHLITKLNQLLEPLIMVILGVLIGGLIIAMYLPIFKLGMIL